MATGPVVEHFNLIEDIRPGQIPGFVYSLINCVGIIQAESPKIDINFQSVSCQFFPIATSNDYLPAQLPARDVQSSPRYSLTHRKS